MFQQKIRNVEQKSQTQKFEQLYGYNWTLIKFTYQRNTPKIFGITEFGLKVVQYVV